jgi:hypothetical protein
MEYICFVLPKTNSHSGECVRSNRLASQKYNYYKKQLLDVVYQYAFRMDTHNLQATDRIFPSKTASG